MVMSVIWWFVRKYSWFLLLPFFPHFANDEEITLLKEGFYKQEVIN